MTAETPDPLTRGNFETFVRAALAGHSDSATRAEHMALQTAQILAEHNLGSLSAPAFGGLLTLMRFLAVTPIWEMPRARAEALLEAVLEPPHNPDPQDLPAIDESLPTWKKLQIAEKRAAEPTRHSEEQLSRVAQLVSELYDPTSTTVAGVPR